MISMIIASKIWDDESFENHNFAKVFPLYDVDEINEMERTYLERIDYDISVPSGDYAKYYFVLRAFARKDKTSYQLRPLDVATILYLQKNCNRAMQTLKQTYLNPPNKSFMLV